MNQPQPKGGRKPPLVGLNASTTQVRALREYAARQGHEIVREFVDEAVSGRTASRPAFREMIALARTSHPPFEAILVWKLNRFARGRVDSITYKTLLRNKGIKVISINEPLYVALIPVFLGLGL